MLRAELAFEWHAVCRLLAREKILSRSHASCVTRSSDRQRSQGACFLRSLLLLTGRSAFIGIGFTDRGDAFDFNVSLQDHFKWVKQETEISKESQEMDSRPKLDLGFKEGQTIKLSIGVGVIPFLYVLLCVWARCLHMFVHHRHSVSGGWKRVSSLWTGVIDGCWLPCGCWESEPWPRKSSQGSSLLRRSPAAVLFFETRYHCIILAGLGLAM